MSGRGCALGTSAASGVRWRSAGSWSGNRTPRSATGASHRARPHRHSACRLATVRWTPMVSTHNPLITSLDRPHGQRTVHAVPWSVTLNNSLQCMHRAVTGNLAVCCIQAVIVAFPSGGHFVPRFATRRSHSASISSYVVSISANAKVSDGSQPPGAPASPLGVPAGARSLDRHGSIESEVLLEALHTQAGRGHRTASSPSVYGSWSSLVGRAGWNAQG